MKLKRLICLFWFWLFGWKVKGKPPSQKKYIVAAAPHTSNWDFFVALCARHIFMMHSNFLGKKSLFDAPIVGWFMKSIGGHPVDRTKSQNLVDQVVELYDQHDEFVIAIAPEGTRSYQPELKTGFYRIAEKAKVPIVLVGLDFANKTVEMRPPFYPTGDLDKDMEKIKAYFRTIKGRNPELGIQ
ncbi:MAG: lysophospholipid acyltransferase family protein [Cyclobacteriaceae bacterium]